MANGKYDQAVVSHICQLVAVLSHIDQLVKEEGRLHTKNGLTEEDRTRLANVEVALDQCGDLLRRRALREFREDQDKAKVVENYDQ
jgi:hypothetical protein